MIIKRIKAVFILCFLFSQPIMAIADITPPSIPGWVLFTADHDAKTVFYGKVGSMKHTATSVSVLIQLVKKDPDSVIYSVASITKETCNDGYGVWNYHNLSGGGAGTIDYVKGGASLGAGVGDILCELIKPNKKA